MIHDLPPNTKNTRYFKDLLANKRPALTFVGFDNGGNNVYGYGLKQALERIHEKNSGQYHLFKYLLKLSKERIRNEGEAPPGSSAQSEDAKNNKSVKRQLVNFNSRILQAKMLVALVTLVLEENDANLADIELPDHQEVMDDVIPFLINKGGKVPLFAHEVLSALEIDRVKWTTSLSNMARAVDLYLSIESAYVHYKKDTRNLLSKKQKNALFDRYIKAIDAVLVVVDSGYGIGKKISGNWSLKMWTAGGYACMAAQERGDSEETQKIVEWFGRSLRRAGPDTSGNRRRYWAFMTSKNEQGNMVAGQRIWGEGPYYMHFIMQEMIPFWHAVRAQGYLHVPDIEPLGVSFTDPFHSNWFANPIEWMADIATPEGGTPPFDDGNRHNMYNANLLNWDGVYGRRQVGQKFHWVYETISGATGGAAPDWGSINNEVLLVDLAIPKTEQSVSPQTLVGNFSPRDKSESQLVLRKEINGKQHYICLHGEGQLASIERGEGHEQPDQLQLLYYIDNQSVIMDAGYDRGYFHKNSRWNSYKDHNVMAYVESDGGLKAPDLFKVITHNPVEYLYIDSRSNEMLTIFKGGIELRYRDRPKVLGGHKDKSTTHYDRTVLFVSDPQAPYLIDVNQTFTEKDKGRLPTLRMRYHVDSNAFAERAQGKWNTWAFSGEAEVDVSNFLGAVEFEPENELLDYEQVEVRERFDPTKAAEEDEINDVEEIEKSDKKNDIIRRLSFTGKKGKKAFATVALFVTGENVELVTSPEPLFSYEEDALRSFQVWQWDNKRARTIDLVFARSYIEPDDIEKAISFEVNVGNVKRRFFAPPKEVVGFARFNKQGRAWQLMPEYLYGLVEATAV